MTHRRRIVIGSAAWLIAASAGAATKHAKGAKGAGAKKVALVDINSASQKQLEALPGVGKEHCHHIIMGRPYENTEELVTREILPKETYEKIKTKIVVKPAKKEAPPKT